MNVQYLQEKTIDMSPLLSHNEAHQIIKDVAKRIKEASEENSKNLSKAIKADELHDKKLDEKIAQLETELEAKQKAYDNVAQAAALKMLELNNAKAQITNNNEEIKRLEDAAEESSKAVKDLGDELNACKGKLEKTKKFAEMKVREEEELKQECAKNKKEASEALETEKKNTENQKKLKKQFEENVVEARKECAKESQKASLELLEKGEEINKLADDVKKEAAAVLAANKAAKTLENALNDKTGELADARNTIERLKGDIKKLREAPSAPANTSGIPDGKLSIKVCRPMGKKGKICGAPAELEVKNGRLANPLPGAKPGDELLEVKKGKKEGEYTVRAPRLKFNPTIKF